MKKQEIFALERPHPNLLGYYFLASLCALIAMPILFLPAFFKYKTLRYRFDEKGISMSWGILFRREIYLTYQKIQDIHLTRNAVERWMGLGKLNIQTASASAGSEMIIVGIPQLEVLRDFIYAQMKGFENVPAGTVDAAGEAEKLMLLTKIHQQLMEINAKLEVGRV